MSGSEPVRNKRGANALVVLLIFAVMTLAFLIGFDIGRDQGREQAEVAEAQELMNAFGAGVSSGVLAERERSEDEAARAAEPTGDRW